LEIIVLVGIPGSGKSTLAKTRFPNHKRLNLDTLHTRKKEDQEIANCLMKGEDVIVDNTNTTRKSRNKYVQIAKLFGIPVRAVYINCPVDLASERNASRAGKEHVPDKAVRFYYKILEPPSTDEGFDSVEELIPDLGNQT
jgi:predicted kinase